MEDIRLVVRVGMVAALAAASFCSFKAAAVPIPRTGAIATFLEASGSQTALDQFFVSVARYTKAAAFFSGLAAVLVAADFLIG